MQEIFAVDEGNYMGHVFAGLAGLELGRYAEAKQHYKTAISTQPDEPLAWKVGSLDPDLHALCEGFINQTGFLELVQLMIQ